jgi:TatD DNase family protein
MLTDAHCHPFDLVSVFPKAEQERRRLGVLAAASACDLEEFTYNEELAKKAVAENYTPLLLCFGVHPQLPAVKKEGDGPFTDIEISDNLETLRKLATAGRLSAVGECGFDLYNEAFKETEETQDALFSAHLEIAVNYGLPVVLHVRRAMHKIFAAEKIFTKCKAVVFHSWSGTLEEARSLLRRGVNAYFSFGNAIMLNHKQAIQCCSLLPAERLLTETDAPFQPRRGEKHSVWADLRLIIETAVTLRNEAGSSVTDAKALESQIDENFRKVFYREPSRKKTKNSTTNHTNQHEKRKVQNSKIIIFTLHIFLI